MYKFNVSIENKNQPPTIISIERNFENTYQAQNELTNIGKNGLIYTNEKGEQKYYPPHRILEIDFE
jgi:hypothetical protein